MGGGAAQSEIGPERKGLAPEDHFAEIEIDRLKVGGEGRIRRRCYKEAELVPNGVEVGAGHSHRIGACTLIEACPNKGNIPVVKRDHHIQSEFKTRAVAKVDVVKFSIMIQIDCADTGEGDGSRIVGVGKGKAVHGSFPIQSFTPNAHPPKVFVRRIIEHFHFQAIDTAYYRRLFEDGCHGSYYRK